MMFRLLTRSSYIIIVANLSVFLVAKDIKNLNVKKKYYEQSQKKKIKRKIRLYIFQLQYLGTHKV